MSTARRRPDAVKELEELQQRVRQEPGEPQLTEEQFIALVREDISKRRIAEALDRGGLDAALGAVGPDADREVEQEVAKLLAAWRLAEPDQWSRFENPVIRAKLAELCAGIEAAFVEQALPLRELPVVGTLTTGQAGATTQKSSSGAPMILIDNGFFKFAGSIAQVAVMSGIDVARTGGFSAATVQILSDLVATHLIAGSCVYTQARKLPVPVSQSIDEQVHSICTFTLSHEYAHLAVGHLDMHPAGAPPAGFDLHALEFEADRIGFMTTTRIAKGSQAAVAAPFLFLAGLDVLNRAAAVLANQRHDFEPADRSTYPSPFQRIFSLLRSIESDKKILAELGPQVQNATQAFHRIINVWNVIMPVLHEGRGALSELRDSQVATLPEVRAFAAMRLLWNNVVSKSG
jgi:hypothetical protein